MDIRINLHSCVWKILGKKKKDTKNSKLVDDLELGKTKHEFYFIISCFVYIKSRPNQVIR